MKSGELEICRRYGGIHIWKNINDKWKLYSLMGSAVIVFLLTALFTQIPPVVATVPGLFGALAVMWMTAPSFVEVNATEAGVLRDRLVRSRFHELPARDAWAPPLPVWLRWRDSLVEFEQMKNSGNLRVTGPRNYLRVLVQGLRSDRDAAS